jgi:tetratricopeptide (TPR) repeat protein
MYYGFHTIEALASFDKATKIDSSFAMAYWGKALAYGPNINDNGYTTPPEAITAMRKAKELSGNGTSIEKALIEAMQVRYSTDTTQTRERLNQLYADAMKRVYRSFPKSADAATLYVDALMQQHPWDLYTKDYKPKPWTPEIVKTLEATLKQSPSHPGASHYYIHAVEASAHPQKGLSVANNLATLMPGMAHVVHMPSHIYIRSGYYEKGEKVNEQAVKVYYNYASKYAPVTNNVPLYLIHNLHMQATCANMDGRFKQAMKASIDTRNSFDSTWQGIPDFTGIYVQYIYMTPYLTLIRFGRWDEILNTPENPANYVYANLLWHYGRGLAYARKHDFTKANMELEALRKGLKNDQLKAPAPSYANPGIAGATVAEKILQGVIAEEQNNLTDAITYMKQAVVLEDSMVYNEPKDWVHPARQYLGNTLLKAKRYKEATQVYEEDLKINPNNGWSLTGLATALSNGGQKQKGLDIKKQADKAFTRKDVQIKNSVF